MQGRFLKVDMIEQDELPKQGLGYVRIKLTPVPIIESSKSIDIGIYYGLSFLWNAESPKNLQQTKAEEAGNSESIGDSDKFPDAL